MKTILVSGALANRPRNGGGAWVRLSWIRGLQRLGFRVVFIEQIAPSTCIDSAGAPASFEDSINLAYFRKVTNDFNLQGACSLILGDSKQTAGLAWDQLLDIAADAALLVNISGHLTHRPILQRVRNKAYIDIDPGFTQFWHAQPGSTFKVSGHDHYFTIAANIGSPDCPIPGGGLPWRTMWQPVVLEDWRGTADKAPRDRFSTVASWRGAFGPVEFDGKTYGLKVHEFRKFLAVPRMVRPGATFELALDIHPADDRDRAALTDHGWTIIDPKTVTATPQDFRHYVQQSSAEFSVAQGIYIDTHSGWFSDRTVRYLASGRPVVVQDTGFSRHLPTGSGLLSFRTPEQAADAVSSVRDHYAEHCEAARDIASRYFSSDVVLSRFLEETGVRP